MINEFKVIQKSQLIPWPWSGVVNNRDEGVKVRSVALPLGLCEEVLEPGFPLEKFGPAEDHQFQPAILSPSWVSSSCGQASSFGVRVLRVKGQGRRVARYKLVANLWKSGHRPRGLESGVSGPQETFRTIQSRHSCSNRDTEAAPG